MTQHSNEQPRLYRTPKSWPFPGPRAVAPAPRKPRMTYTYTVPDELRHLFAPDRLNADGTLK